MEVPVQELPLIFLSHSGQQKDFTERLYYELLHLNHKPFFDQDAQLSLPKGTPFPLRIVEACQQCKMGVVVLSHDYIESLWPMLELEQLVFHSSAKIYPLFYKLKPADLTSDENLRRWQSKWDEVASSWQSKQHAMAPFSINISLWPEALEKLRIQSGEVPEPNMRDHAYIQKIVSNICKTLPPPLPYLLSDNCIKGTHRMAQELADLFHQLVETSSSKQDNNSHVTLGVYGVGGSGKTTLCKNMANFYNRDFLGRSCCLELPSEKDEKQLLEELKKVLRVLVQASDEILTKISTADQAMGVLKDDLKRYNVFLAIDNVWEWAFESARELVGMEYMAGSKLMVTSRSKQLLKDLLPNSCAVVHVPSITEEEAIGALMSYGTGSGCSHAIPLEDLRSLARSCFFEGNGHPLLLKAMGARLRAVGEHMHNAKDWKDHISRLQSCPNVLSVLGTSYLAMNPSLQRSFLDLVTCVPPRGYDTFLEKCEWLSMLRQEYTKEDMRYQLIQLEYHGLLELKGARKEQVVIHELLKSVAESFLIPNAPAECLFEADQSVLCTAKWTKLKCIRLDDFYYRGYTWSELRHCSELEIFILAKPIHLRRLSVQGLGSLRILQLNCKNLKEIKDWKGAPNLVSVELSECGGLRKIGQIGCLQKLEKFAIVSRYFYENFRFSRSVVAVDLPDLTRCSELKTLVFSSKYLKQLASLGQPPKLQELDLSYNINLVDVGTIGSFTALQQVKLCGCSKLKEFPNINLSKLLTLDMSGCGNLRSMQGSVCALTALEELKLDYCSELERVPDLNNLARLRLLSASGCRSLKELTGVSALTSLRSLELAGCINVFNSQMACGLKAFVNLRELKIESLQLEVPLDMSGLANLEVLHTQNLQMIPGLNALVNLRELRVFHSPSLKQIADGLTNLKKLKIECPLSEILPDLRGLTSLETLRLRKCSSLQAIPGVDTLTNLSDLTLKGHETAVQMLPLFASLKSLKFLFLRECRFGVQGTSINIPVGLLTSLWFLYLCDCSSLRTLPDLPISLVFLDVSRCYFLTNVSSLTSLTTSSLQYLVLEDCSSLRNLPDLRGLTNLRRIDLEGCSSLRNLPDLRGLTNLRSINLRGCSSLRAVPKVSNTTEVDMGDQKCWPGSTFHMNLCGGSWPVSQDNCFP